MDDLSRCLTNEKEESMQRHGGKELIGKIQRVEMDLTFSKNAGRRVWLEHSKGEGTERKGCRSARWTVSNTRWPWVGGSHEGVWIYL